MSHATKRTVCQNLKRPKPLRLRQTTAAASGRHMRHFFSSSALVTTLTELSAMAAPATTGLR